jgi:alkenylglycerophosphocholine/alkenylglycerophosphoethanolamine hydrolase
MTETKKSSPPIPRWLLPVFAIPVFAYFVGLGIDSQALRVAVKAIPVLALAVGVWLAVPHTRYRRLVAAGLLFGSVGDLFLEIDLFELGLGAFLIGQVLYTSAFLGDTSSLKPLAGLAFYSYGLVLVWALADSTGDLLIPVAAYALAITTMLWRAVARVGMVPRTTGLAAAYGAGLFVVSDSLIAINRFGTDVPGDRWLVMSTYWAAQALIAYSAFRHER